MNIPQARQSVQKGNFRKYFEEKQYHKGDVVTVTAATFY